MTYNELHDLSCGLMNKHSDSIMELEKKIESLTMIKNQIMTGKTECDEQGAEMELLIEMIDELEDRITHINGKMNMLAKIYDIYSM